LKEGPYVKVTIRDHGKGIAPEHISKVFDPYFSTKGRSSEKGTGLSLAVALSVVVRHGGFLDIESEVGKGTALYIYVPAVERASRKTQEP
jgi:two-component system cell cycle sensor histidine kinase/response regulator CckA